MNAYLGVIFQPFRDRGRMCGRIISHLSADGTTFPTRKGSNFNPVRRELLKEGEGVVDRFAVEDMVPEEQRGGRLGVTTSK